MARAGELSPKTWLMIRALETEDCSKRDVAARFGVSEQRVGQICREHGVLTPKERRRRDAINDLRAGLTYKQAATKHGLDYERVVQLATRAGLRNEPPPHEKSVLVSKLDRERCTKEGGLLELFIAHDYEGSVAATGFVATLDYLPVYESAGLTIFSEEPGDYVLMHHAAKRALEWAAGQRYTALYLHAPGVLYREMNQLSKPQDPILWLETWNLCRQLGAQVVQAGNLHPQRKIAEKVAGLLAEHATPQPEPPGAEILARLLRDRYPAELLRQLARLL